MAGETKMVDLTVDETSGVDHPAHLVEGWIVAKAADPAAAAAMLQTIQSGKTTKDHDVADDKTPDAGDSVDKDATIDALTKQVEALTAEVAKTATPDTGKADALDPDVEKSLPDEVREMLKAVKADATAARAEAATVTLALEKSRVEKADSDAVDLAKAWSNIGVDAAEFGPRLRALGEHDADLRKSVESTLSALSEQVRLGDLFKQTGPRGQTSAAGDAYDEMQTLAKAAVAAGEQPTVAQAMANVAKSNPDLATRYRAERKEA